MKNFGIKIEPRDPWVGLFIGPEKYPIEGGRTRKFFLCLIPTVVIWWRRFYV